MNINLLCHFSPYYHAALQGGFKEARKKSLDVDTDEETLVTVIFWLYHGQLPTAFTSFDSFTRKNYLLKLYIFADRFDILALRRYIISHWASTNWSTNLLSFSQVAFAYTNLPTSSPMLRYIVDVTAWHRAFGADDTGRDVLPLDFVYSVLERKDELAFRGGSVTKCPCCFDTCHYHEHESEEERYASE